MSRVKSTIDPGTDLSTLDPASPIVAPETAVEDLAVGDPAQE